MRPATGGALFSSRRLARGVFLNGVGLVVPLLLALLAIPLLLRNLGVERFGLLSLAWAALAWAALCDLGAGRAVTWKLSRELGSGAPPSSLGRVVAAALVMVGPPSLLLGAGLLFAAPWVASRIPGLQGDLAAEATAAIRWLAVAMPPTVVLSPLRGTLEAVQRFDLVAGLRLLQAIGTFAVPAIAAMASFGLEHALAGLVFGRFVTLIVAWRWCRGLVPLPLVPRPAGLETGAFREMARFAGWMTVTATVTPLMTYADRFVLASAVSVEATGYATTAFEVATRTSVVPVALVGVLFPAFSATRARSPSRLRALHGFSVRTLFALLAPVTLLLVGGAEAGLRLWVGDEVAAAAAPALRIFAVGAFVNGLAHVPFSLIQGCGRSDLTGRFHLAQLLPYVVLVGWLVRELGVTGAALAWTIRALIDAAGLFLIARRLLGSTVGELPLSLSAAVFSAGLAAVFFTPVGTVRTVALGVALAGLAATMPLLFSSGERSRLWSSFAHSISSAK